MKSAVFYCSRTGNTRKVAGAMAQEMGTTATRVQRGTPIPTADCLFIGAAVYAIYDHDIAPELKSWIESLDPKKTPRAVIFGTGFSGSNILEILRKLLTTQGLEVAQETFFCEGGFLIFNWGHPNAQDKVDARAFALKMQS